MPDETPADPLSVHYELDFRSRDSKRFGQVRSTDCVSKGGKKGKKI